MKRDEILDTARAATMGDRSKTHGDPYLQHHSAAGLITAYLDGRLKDEVRAKDVAIIMLLVKISRQKFNDKEDDHFVDMCGYAAIAGQIAAVNRLEPAAVEVALANLMAQHALLPTAAELKAETNAEDEGPVFDVRGLSVKKGAYVKFFPADDIWLVVETYKTENDIPMLRVRHYPTHREQHMLAKNLFSVVEL